LELIAFTAVMAVPETANVALIESVVVFAKRFNISTLFGQSIGFSQIE